MNARVRCSMFGVGCSMFAVLLLAGCATTPQSGAFATLQAADNLLAAKFNVPAPVVAQVRSALGIPVAKDLPTADRILPVPWTVYYDMLDRQEQVVDTTGFHYGTTPRLRNNSTALPVSVFNPTPAAAANAVTLESILAILGSVTSAKP